MSNRLYPTWDQLETMHNPLTNGEKALIEYLDKYLPGDDQWKEGDSLLNYKGWLIFAQPFLNGTRPDVIIFNPQVGLVIYEVKDWNLNNYEVDVDENKSKKGRLFVHDKRGKYEIKSPIKQVEHYKEVLIGQLIPNIGENIDDNNKNFGLIKTGVYFHNSTTEKCQSLFSSMDSIVLKSFFPFFGFDTLKEDTIDIIVPDIKRNKSIFWKNEWNKDILFWLKPPYHSIEQGKVLTLKGLQNRIAEPQRGHFRVRGVAGSGKTQALAYRAAKLASLGYQVLVISFNITLWHYIKDMIARAPFNFSWDKFVFTHFHGFCKDRLNEFGEKWPEGNGDNYFFKEVIPDAVKKAIQGRNYQKFDAILIDEGQDYEYEWYSMLDEHFLNSRNELLIVSDKRQNIFQRELDWLDKRVTRQGLEKFGDYIDLTTSYRLPPKVSVMANEFATQFGLNQELKVVKTDNAPPLFYTEHIVWKNINHKDWLEEIYDSFKRLKREEESASDIVFLLPNHKIGMEAVDFFKTDQKIEVNHVFEIKNKNVVTNSFSQNYNGKTSHYHKKAFWQGDSRIKMCTIHSFKGWELDNIVLFIPNLSRNSFLSFNEKSEDEYINWDMLVYTAITRTKKNLIVLNANPKYNEFGNNYPQNWNE